MIAYIIRNVSWNRRLPAALFYKRTIVQRSVKAAIRYDRISDNFLNTKLLSTGINE
jgi:hypothetical protein